MTFVDVLRVALDVIYLALVVVAIRDHRRRPDADGLAVVGVFASVAAVFVSSSVGRAFEAVSTPVNVIAFVALLALPVFTLHLVRQFHAIPRWGIPVALGLLVLFIAVIGVAAVGIAAGADVQGAAIVLLLGSFAFFIALEAVNAVVFGLAARRRSGSSRLRLALAGLATAVLGAAALLLLGVSAIAGGGDP